VLRYARFTFKEATMELRNNLGNEQIRTVIEQHPRIGEILNDFEIACVTCGVGICLLKDVVAIHALGAELEQKIEKEINAYLDGEALTATPPTSNLVVDATLPITNHQ
jgi:hypothetical protein